MSFTESQVQQALAEVVDPNTGKDLVATKSVKAVRIDAGSVSVDVELGYPAKTQHALLQAMIEEKLRAIPGAGAMRVKVESRIVPHTVQRGVKLIPGIKNIVAVASGKGGVGKSTTAVNIALGLQASGLKVGVLDADIYGPSMPRLLGIKGRPQQIAGDKLAPMEAYGLKVMSMGFLVDEETPMIWRGPMVMSALSQMLKDVAWGELDVLVVDMPPGTGDAQLTMAQQVPLAGAIIVSTPQDLALIDARKGLNMFRKVDVPVLGIVENMSTFICPHCGAPTDIFAHGGAQSEAERLGVPFLGEVPLTVAIRETSDAGKPVVASDPKSPAAEAYRVIANAAWAELERHKGEARSAPRIVMEG